MEQQNTYKALDFFLLRTPVLPFDSYTSCFPEEGKDEDELRTCSVEHLLELSMDAVVREAIAVASPSLYASLCRLNPTDGLNKQEEQTLRSVMRYVIRMMTRPTPFGLFSGVTVGHFASTSQLTLQETSSYRKRARPDMEWVLKIMEQIESIPEVLEQLHIHANPLIYRQGNRAKIPFATRYGKLNYGENDSVSVRASAVFDFVMDLCVQPLLFSKLIHLIQEQHPETDRSYIYQYVTQLLKQEFLISELRPSTIQMDPFAYILSKVNPLNGMDDLKAQLNKINNSMELYNKTLVGEGEGQLNSIRQAMNQLANMDTPVLQVDLSLADASIRLNEHVRKEVEQTAEILNALALPVHHHLKEYADEFLEKYGDYREVPLLELLDEDLGLGAPATYRHPQSRHRFLKSERGLSKRQLEREQLLFGWFVSAIHKGSYELQLTDEMVNQLIHTEELQTRPSLPSMELYFLLNTRDQQALDQGDYTLLLGPNPGSTGAGKTFGRFLDLFEPSFHEEFQTIFREENRLHPDRIWAEVSYLPSAGKTTNVVLTKNFRDYEITLGTTPSIPAECQIQVGDLLVGVRNGLFYLKSKTRNQEVIPTAGHMLNFHQAPNVYRFLIEVGLTGFEQWTDLNWGTMMKAPFIPRLQYKKTILSPATWKMQLHQNDTQSIDLKNKQDVSKVKEWMVQFFLVWKVPRYVYMIQSDNRILLDLQHPLHVEELLKPLKSGEQVTLIEHIGGFHEMPIRRNDGKLTAEFVFPFVRRPSSDSSKLIMDMKKTSHTERPHVLATQHSNQRVHLPGGDWFYAKLYGMESRQHEFIGLYWEKCIRQARDAEMIEHGYYIRYADPEPHIRVRFKIKDDRTIPSFFTMFHEWSVEWLQEGFITRFVIDTYEPEIERYGGIDLMKLAESLFAGDSEVAASLVRLNRFGHAELESEMVAVLSVINLLQQLGFSEYESFETLNQKFDVKDYLDDFRQNRRLYLQLLNNSDALDTSQIQQRLDSIFKLREAGAVTYRQALLEHENQQDLMNSTDNIVFSIIHMHLNRLLGIDRRLERKVMIMARHVMNSLVHYHRKAI